MNMRKPKSRLGSSILILFILTMSFSILITPLVSAKVTSGIFVFEQSQDRLTSLESIDTPSIREIDTPTSEIDTSYNYDDSIFTPNSEWNVEQPEREPYLPKSVVMSPGTPHSTIEITSNGDFTTQGWPGDGSPGTPFVINDLEINASLTEPGISITGTDVHFIISNCSIHGGFVDSKGIVLNDVENAVIFNNTCYEGGIGILLNQTDGISLIENKCYAMNRAGIYLDGSDGNTIQRNIATDCWDGIYLEQSSFNFVDENFCAGNNWGIDLYWMSNENDVYNNTLISNIECGILLHLECTLNTIEMNYLDDNSYAIFIRESDENSILTNYCESNGIEIELLETEFNVVDNNTLYATSGTFGLFMVNNTDTLITNNLLITIENAIFITGVSSRIDLLDNNCTHFEYGLTIEDGDDILVQDCYFDSIYYSGCIHAIRSTNLDIIDSTFIQTDVQIFLDSCVNVNIIGNIVEDYLGGIISIMSNSTTIKDNLCQYGEQGIVGIESYDLTIHNNTVLYHGSPGSIFVGGSPYVEITDNNCSFGVDAISIDTCERALIENNFCYLYEQGILVVVSNYTTIAGNHVQNGMSGIIVGASFYVDILDNDVINNVEGATGIHIDDSGYCVISRNNCTGNEVPSIYIETSPYCEVTYNIITDTIDGIVLGESNHTTITDNHITMGQGYGIAVWTSSHCFVSRNHIANISGWEGWAIAFSGYDNEFTYNLCDNSTVGIYADDALIPSVTHNSAHGNEEAIWLTPACTNATISWNIFEDNIHNGLDESMTAFIDYNYWSNYTGIDSNGDGIGDTWHPIDGPANNNDTHPLVYHPTLPTWLQEPSDQIVEYGQDFSYGLATTASTILAPIADWWISDTTYFSIDDGAITNTQDLAFTVYILEVRAINLYGYELKGTFNVTVVDTIDPIISGPDDYSMVYGSTGHILNWTLHDAGPASFSIWIDGLSRLAGEWTVDGEVHGVVLDDWDLEIGEHTIEMRVTDIGGNTATDTVIVTVTAPADMTTLLLAVGAGGAIIAVIVIIYVVKKKGAGT
ncbi:MAG: NosD domain-containing protein [Candidatus Thorarchaeota archaeon]